MHLGYHELRNMLIKFKEDRDKRKMGPPATVPSGAPPSGAPAQGGPPPRGGDRGDYRSSRDDYRERDRGYGDRGYSRHE